MTIWQTIQLLECFQMVLSDKRTNLTHPSHTLTEMGELDNFFLFFFFSYLYVRWL
jgi:hypothetical protein